MKKQKFYYLVKWRIHQLFGIITRKGIKYKSYNGKIIIGNSDANELIKKAILKGKPFLAGRFGSTELYALQCVNDNDNGFDYDPTEALDFLCKNSGFFPMKRSLLFDFSIEMKTALYQVDLLAVWYLKYEEYMAKTFSNNPDYCLLGALEPYGRDRPWSEALEGKKVLVVHPFAETIESQYRKRELLFSNPKVLPEFQLITYKAVQTIAGNKDERFNTWFDALDFMSDEISRIDFDVAIVGCGAYGLPLSARIKKMGKVAIHMGGATQLLFGIKGRRWEKIESVKKLFNEHWVRPSERPDNYDSIEDGCYW